MGKIITYLCYSCTQIKSYRNDVKYVTQTLYEIFINNENYQEIDVSYMRHYATRG